MLWIATNLQYLLAAAGEGMEMLQEVVDLPMPPLP